MHLLKLVPCAFVVICSSLGFVFCKLLINCFICRLVEVAVAVLMELMEVIPREGVVLLGKTYSFLHSFGANYYSILWIIARVTIRF